MFPNFAMVILGATLMVCSPALAESDGDLVCAAIHPCNSDGTVYAPYNSGECAAKYALECAGDVTNKVGDALVSCENSRADLQDQLNKLAKKLARLQRAARKPVGK